MLEQVKTYLEMASGIAEIPRQQAEKLAKRLAKRGEVTVSQVGTLAEEIVKRSQQNAQTIQSLVSHEIRRQIKTLGLATRDDIDRINRKIFGLANGEDLDRLIRRIEKLETKPRSVAKTAAAKKPTSKK